MDKENIIKNILETSPKKERREQLLKVLPPKYVDILLYNINKTEEFYRKKIDRNEKIYLSLAYEDEIINIMDKYWEDTH